MTITRFFKLLLKIILPIIIIMAAVFFTQKLVKNRSAPKKQPRPHLGALVETTAVRSGAAANLPATPGHGLLGIRERVEAFGGQIQTGPRVGGGFAVEARIPLGANR